MTMNMASDSMMASSLRRLLVAALLLGAVGCGPTFDPASQLETTRVLGARVTAGTDTPSRASPLPGRVLRGGPSRCASRRCRAM
jgi:hypothetical protein